jgi:glycosyltransferase involved in cell wall biosynthesis
MPRVTVAIPAYKPQHLSQAIASVLAQTFTDFELLVSDDCRDPSVQAVLAQFGDPRIRVIRGPRKGLVANSVHLWENAAADALKFVYDDDFLLPFALAELVELLDRQADLTFAFCGRHVVDVEGRILRSHSDIAGGPVSLFTGVTVIEALVSALKNPIGEPSNLLIRRSMFPNADCLRQYCDVQVRHHIDVAFFLNAAERGLCIGTRSFGAAFRNHANQVSSLRQATDFSYGVAEWELFIRGAVCRGVIPPQATLPGVDRLELHYRNHLAQFPELNPMLAGLPRLRAALQAGVRDVLDDGFLTRLAAIESTIEERKSPRQAAPHRAEAMPP